MNDLYVLNGNKISFTGNNQYNYWFADIITENGVKKLVNKVYPYEDDYDDDDDGDIY